MSAKTEKSDSWIRLTIIFTNVFFIILILSLIIKFGSLKSTLAVLKGDVLISDSVLRSFGSCIVGESIDVISEIRNVSSGRVKVGGARTSCGCVVIDDLPLYLPPYSERRISIHITPPKENDQFKAHLILLTSVPQQPEYIVEVTGVVKSATSGE
jgi:hypothetical protein